MVRVGKRTSGYTIIEVMIFLAISSVMFLLAAAFVSGRQSQVDFSQGMAEAKIKLQETINNVVNGYYPARSNFSCTDGPPLNNRTTLQFSNVSAPEGSNTDCMFLGYAVQYGIQGTNSQSYALIPIAVSSVNYTNNSPTSSISQVVPTPLTNDQWGTASLFNGVHVDLTQTDNLGYGIHVTDMYIVNNSSNPATYTSVGGIAFLSSFSLNGSASGVQSVTPYIIPNLQLNAPTEGSAINGVSPASEDITLINVNNELLNSQAVLICFQGGSNNQIGSITIGSNNNQSDVNLHIMSGVSSQCPS